MSDSEYGILDVIYESVKNLNKAGLISDERVEMFYVACFDPECSCGNRLPHEPWEEGCDLGNNEEFARLSPVSFPEGSTFSVEERSLTESYRSWRTKKELEWDEFFDKIWGEDK